MDGHVPSQDAVFTALFLFAGIGAGALGFLDAQVDINGRRGRFRSIGGVDLDKVACKDFERLTKSPSRVADIAKMTPGELREFAGEKAPDVVFMSAPCKAFSGLMSPKKAATPKYVAMARLAVDGVQLTLDAWGSDGPKLILFENVPRIATRGAKLLAEIRKLLQRNGYVTHEGSHNCGRIGNLAQSRERFLLVARHAVKVPVFLYQPPEKPLRPCGDVLETLPLPGDARAGRLHRMPEISARTWARLASIRPGKDWRDLSTLDGEQRPAWARYAVGSWSMPSRAVAGSGTNSAWGIGDVRVTGEGWRAGVLGVVATSKPFGTITGRESPTNGAFSLADVRLAELDGRSWYQHVLRVGLWTAPIGTVTSATHPAGGSPCVSDLRLRAEANPRCYGVLEMGAPAGTITGNASPGGGAHSIADLRLEKEPWRTSGVLGVLSWGQPSYTITGALDLWAGWAAVADPRGAEAIDTPAVDPEDVLVAPRGPARPQGVRRGVPAIEGYWFASDPRVPSNPPLVVRWCQADLDDPPPYIPVLPGRGDGSWHRPLTLLERARLQGLPMLLNGVPLVLSGTLSQISEHIGNAVPVGAALAIAGEMLRTLVLAASGAFFLSSASGVWVKRRRDGSFPLYVEQALRGVSKRKRRKVRQYVARVPHATLVEGRA